MRRKRDKSSWTGFFATLAVLCVGIGFLICFFIIAASGR